MRRRRPIKRTPRVLFLLSGLLALLLAGRGDGATLYTSTTAVSTTPPCTSGSPCTKAYVLANAVAGDEVRIMAGTYVGEWIPANSGTPGNRIIFRADPAASADTVILQNGYTSDHANTPGGTFQLCASGVGRSWIQIGPGLLFNADVWPPQVSSTICADRTSFGYNVVIGNTFDAPNSSGSGATIHQNNSVISMTGRHNAVIDNVILQTGAIYSAITLQGPGGWATGNTINRSTTCTGTCSGLENLTNGGVGAWLANNQLLVPGSNVGGIALWCDVSGNRSTWINNYVRGPWTEGLKDEFACAHNTFQYNIFNNNDGTGGNKGPTPASNQHHHTFINNTMYSNNFYGYETNFAEFVTFRHNVILDTTTPLTIAQSTVDTAPNFDYNVYCKAAGACGTTIVDQKVDDSGVHAPSLTLAQWQTAMGGEANSTVGDPLFTNAAGENFSVTSGPAFQTGLGGINRGACPGNTFACGTPAAVPTITVAAVPATVTQGKPAILEYQAPTATRCTVPWSVETGSYGRSVQTPSSTTTYTVTCTNPHGSVDQTATITVTPPVTTPSPVAWWKLESGSPTTQDNTASNLDGTLVGSPTYTTGQLGQGLALNGTSQYVTFSNNAAFNPTNALSIAAWVNFNTAHNNTMMIFTKDDFGPPFVGQYALSLFRDSISGKRSARFVITSSTDEQLIASSLLLDPNTWYHIVGTYDGTTVALYINGVQHELAPYTGVMADTGIAPRLGQWGTSVQWFGGILDDVRIYNVGLTQAEVQAIMTATSFPPTLAITTPTTPHSTDTSPLTTLAGTATDDVAVSTVTWQCPTCTPTSGTATGTTAWSVASIGLASGVNVITVTATDAESQIATGVLTVTYTPVVPSTSAVAPGFSGHWAR